ELTLFCFLTGNADMHLKNFSLFYRLRGEIALSPAYDLVPTALLLPEDKEETALTLNGRKRRLTKNDFIQFGGSLKLNKKQIENAYARFSKGLVPALEMLQRGFCTAEVKQRYTNLIKARTVRLGLG